MARKASIDKDTPTSNTDDTPEVEATNDAGETSNSPAETEIIVSGGSSSKKTVLVANQYSGIIMFPRRGEGGVSLNPLMLAPGMVTEIDASEWEQRKKSKVVQSYMDNKLLVEVQGFGVVPTVDVLTKELIVPEHLRTAEEQGAYATASVRTDRTKTGEIAL